MDLSAHADVQIYKIHEADDESLLWMVCEMSPWSESRLDLMRLYDLWNVQASYGWRTCDLWQAVNLLSEIPGRTFNLCWFCVGLSSLASTIILLIWQLSVIDTFRSYARTLHNQQRSSWFYVPRRQLLLRRGRKSNMVTAVVRQLTRKPLNQQKVSKTRAAGQDIVMTLENGL